MLGMIVYRTPGAPEPALQTVAGVRFRAAYVPRGASWYARLSALAASRAFSGEGVRQVLFPPEYRFDEIFAQRGVFPVRTAPLYRATAAAIVRRCLAQKEVSLRGASVVLAEEHASPELLRAAGALCADVRRLTIAAAGAEMFAREQRLRRGIAVCMASPGRELPRADLSVAFDDSTVCGSALRLDEALCVEYDAAYPTTLLAALWSVGAVDADTLSIGHVEQY